MKKKIIVPLMVIALICVSVINYSTMQSANESGVTLRSLVKISSAESESEDYCPDCGVFMSYSPCECGYCSTCCRCEDYCCSVCHVYPCVCLDEGYCSFCESSPCVCDE